MKALKWIAKVIWTVMMTVFFVVLVLMFSVIVSLPFILFAVTHSFWWLLIYLALFPLLLIEK